VEGSWLAGESLDLTFNRDVYQGYNRIDGEVNGRDVRATMARGIGGDTDMRLDGGRFEVDRDRTGENVEVRGSEVTGRVRRELSEGDEQGEFRLEGERIRFSIDRDPRSGDFAIAGKSSAGPFRLNATRERRDGDLSLVGSLPEGCDMFPICWEILGDDKDIPDRNPLYPASLLGMSLFFDQKISDQ